MTRMIQNYSDTDMRECPVADIQKIVSGKWTMVIIYYLSLGTMRFGELSRKMPYVPQSNLTRELRLLEEYGLIHREVYPVVPPKVEYSLSEIGWKFMPVLEALEKFALEYRKDAASLPPSAP